MFLAAPQAMTYFAAGDRRVMRHSFLALGLFSCLLEPPAHFLLALRRRLAAAFVPFSRFISPI
jgi:hypothetical protein